MQSTFAFLLCAATVSAIYLNNPNSYTKRRQLRNLPRSIRAIRPRYVEPNDDSVYLRDTDFSLITSDVMNNRDTLPDSDDLFNAPISLGSSIRCTLPIKRGRCLALNPRYGFDGKTGRCVKFIYGGCGGNANNFETLKECQKTCLAYTPMPL